MLIAVKSTTIANHADCAIAAPIKQTSMNALCAIATFRMIDNASCRVSDTIMTLCLSSLANEGMQA
jgi:hypothetical protein